MLFLEVDDNDVRASTTTNGATAATAEPGCKEATTRAEVKWRTGPKGRAPEKGPPVGACGERPVVLPEERPGAETRVAMLPLRFF
jgi:hypothetical protein